MFYFGTHEVGKQKKNTLLPFVPYRDKFTLFKGSCPKVLLEGVLEAEVNPAAKPDDTLSGLNSDAQVEFWRNNLKNLAALITENL